jgi:hypothetical protein
VSKPTTGDIELSTLLRVAMRGMGTRKMSVTLTVPDSGGVESITFMQRLEVLWCDGVWRKGTIYEVSIATNPACAVPKLSPAALALQCDHVTNRFWVEWDLYWPTMPEYLHLISAVPPNVSGLVHQRYNKPGAWAQAMIEQWGGYVALPPTRASRHPHLSPRPLASPRPLPAGISSSSIGSGRARRC